MTKAVLFFACKLPRYTLSSWLWHEFFQSRSVVAARVVTLRHTYTHTLTHTHDHNNVKKICVTQSLAHHHLGGGLTRYEKWNTYLEILPPTVIFTFYSLQNWKWGSAKQWSRELTLLPWWERNGWGPVFPEWRSLQVQEALGFRVSGNKEETQSVSPQTHLLWNQEVRCHPTWGCLWIISLNFDQRQPLKAQTP